MSFKFLAAGEKVTCAGDGTNVYCWGDGKLSTQSTTVTNGPILVPELAGASQLGLGREHGCAIKEGYLWCWGVNSHLQVKSANLFASILKPVSVFKVDVCGNTKIVLGVGDYFNLLWEADPFDDYCYGGDDTYGQIGPYTKPGSSSTPTGYFDGKEGFSPNKRWTGYGSSSMINGSGLVRLVGYNQDGRLGSPKSSNADIVQDLKNIDGVAMGNGHTCAWQKGGRAWCWGVNASGQLGIDSSASEQLTPTEIKW